MSCVESVCQKSLRESVEHAGRLVAACIEVVCASGVFGLITSRYLNCLSDLILQEAQLMLTTGSTPLIAVSRARAISDGTLT